LPRADLPKAETGKQPAPKPVDVHIPDPRPAHFCGQDARLLNAYFGKIAERKFAISAAESNDS
jgi:hypothetical protein